MNKKRSIWLALAIIGLIIISVFCALTVIGIVNLIKNENDIGQIFNRETVRATAAETITVAPDDLTKLVFDLDFSDIEIKTSEDDQITLELDKTAWANTEEAAQEAVETLTLQTKQTGSTLTFSIPRQPEGVVFIDQHPIDMINITLYVPQDMEVVVTLNSGEVVASSYQGSLDVENDFGNTTVTDFQGRLALQSSNGKITLEKISLTEAFSLSTDFGEINVTDLQAPEIEIKNQSGSFNLTDLTAAGECSLSSDFTDIEVETIECGTLTVESKNGPIEITHGQIAGPLSIETDFGALTLKDVTAESYFLASNNGAIYADSVQGEVTIEADFGDIELYGTKNPVTLNLESQNGNIYFAGVLNPEADHSVSSDFGKVEVRIPADSAFDILLSTDFGELETDLPITLSGKLDATQMEGQINGGGALLEMKSNNGDIILKTLDN